MKKLVSFILSAAMLFGLAGCSDGSGSTSSASVSATEAPAATASAAEAAAAGADIDTSTMTIAIAMQFDTLDPALSQTVYNGYVINSIYSGLLELDDDGLPAPCMAESYDISDDGLTWTFHLRKDLTFSDGSPITSENFRFALKRLLSYSNENAAASSTWTEFIKGAAEYRENAIAVGSSYDCRNDDDSVLGVETPDDYTYSITLNYPVSYLDVDVAGGGRLSPMPLDTPQHDSTWSITPGYLTCGRYTLEEFSLNDRAVLKKDPNYFAADEVIMEELVWQVMTDTSAQEAAFKTGDIDIALNVSTDCLADYQGTENLWTIMYPSEYSIMLNSGVTGPDYLKNENVRKALYISIDKAAIVNVIGSEDMYPVLNGVVPRGLPGVDGDFRLERDEQGYEALYNPEEAAELLRGEGYSEENPLHITYKYTTNSIHGDVATMLQNMWSKIGDSNGDGKGVVVCDFDAVEGGVYYGEIDEGKIELGRLGYQVSDSPMTMLLRMASSRNVIPLMEPEFQAAYDKMLDDAAHLADQKEFAKALHEAEDFLVQEHFLHFPLFMFTPNSGLVQSNLRGYNVKITTLDFAKCYRVK